MPNTIDSALTTLARAKNHLDISGNSKNTVLTAIIIGASAFVESYCRRKFGRTAYTDVLLNGSGSRKLYARQSPIISGQTISLSHLSSIDDVDGWSDLNTDDYRIDYEFGYFYLRAGCWIEGLKNYKASYTAGYYLPSDAHFQDGTDDDLDLPADLELAVLDIVASVFSRRKSAGRTSERVYQVSVTYAKTLSEDPILKETLDRYKKMSYA